MERVEIQSITIHGDKDQKERISALRKFRDGLVRVLIATDVSARGIDIAGVEYVVNYDLPEQPENYVHRVGRTGRGKKRGIAISFCSPEEKDLLDAIEVYTSNDIARLELTKGDYEMTLSATSESKADWKSLVEQAELDEAKYNKGKKKKK
jgi:ATP-dependent RNA helicase RhlE